jgi:hypothetical protein
MANHRQRCSSSRTERAVLAAATTLIRVSLVIVTWRLRSASRVAQHGGGAGLWIVEFAAATLGLVLRTGHWLGRVLGIFEFRTVECKSFERDSLGAEIATWSSTGRPMAEG